MSGTVWANAETANGDVEGIGPLELLSFSHTKRLDRAGSISFAISGVTGRTYLVQPRRYIRAFGMVGDGATPDVTELGIGIVDSITLNSDYSLSVEGDDLMRELANRNVHDLSLFDDYVRIADESRYGAATDYIERITDDDPATSSLIDMADGEYWTMGDDAVFDRVRWHLASFNHETYYDPFTFAFEYLNPVGPTWTSFSITDETAVTDDNGRTSIYGRGGDWYWTIPGGWGPAAHNGQTKWWIRWKQTGVNYQHIYCTELRIVHRTGTTQALPTLLQYTGLTGVTPAWTVDTTGHAETSKDVLLTFAGESVLEALIRVAEVTGDHFTLGTGRTVKWFWEADFVNASPVIRCERATTNVKAMESNSEIAILLDCPRVIDTYDLVTRLYPYGGGSGDDRISLKQLPATKTAPTNYYLDRTNNYLSRPAATNQYGLVEREEVWGDINAETENAAGREAAALKLFDAAFEHLKRFSQPQVIYSLRLAKCERLLLPGDKLRIIWHEWRPGQGEHVIEIDALVYALETTVRYDQSGAMTTEVVCSTIDRWPISGETMVIQALERLRHLQAHSTYATQNYVGAEVAAGLGDAANVEVRDEQNIVIFRANRIDQIVELGPSTIPHIEYDGTQVLVAGSPIAPVLRASATWNPANMVDTAVTSTTITVTGAAAGDVALASHDQIGANDVLVSAHVQAADTVRVVIHNKTGGDLNIASGTLYVTVWKRP